jgi:hypothetical protein
MLSGVIVTYLRVYREMFLTTRKTKPSGLKAERCGPVVFTVSTNNEAFRPAQPSFHYNIATCFDPLFGPSPDCRLTNFKQDRQCTCNIEARPCNRCCIGKTVSITQPGCVFL